MKKIISLFIIATALMTSCSDFLDVVPDGTPDIEYAFRDRVGAEKYLATCYSGLPDMGNPSELSILGSDETFMFYNTSDGLNQFGYFNSYWMKKGEQNASNPYCNFWDGLNSGKNMWQQIRNCNIFLENIDKVGPQLSDEDKQRWIAEVKTLKAYYHFYLLRLYGPIPLKEVNLSVEASTEEVRVYRNSFDDCLTFIDKLLEEAIEYLPVKIEDRTTEMGRLTKAAALSIRADLWLTAASPLFNGNAEYKDFADNKGVKLFPQEYDPNKWQKAAEFSKAAIDAAIEGGNELYKFDDTEWKVNQLSDQRKLEQTLRCAFSDRWNNEIIWGMTKNTVSDYQFGSMPLFITDDLTYVPTRPCVGVTMATAERFYTINGVPINEDNTWDYPNRYKTVKTTAALDVKDAAGNTIFQQNKFIQDGFETATLNTRREMRYYANIGFDGGYWWGNGNYTEIPYALKMKQGDVSGKQANIRYYITGMAPKKPCNVKSVRNPKATGNQLYRYSFPIYRLADLYLMYAEAMNEANGPSEDVYTYLDMVRSRAGLKGAVESWKNYSIYPDKPTTKEGLREIIHMERNNELCMEGKRFWDVRRWKVAHLEANGPVKGWNVEASTAAEYYQPVVIDNLKFGMRDYLAPIRTYDLRVNTNLIQNPYWE
jgi:hypothetical protein